MHDKFQTLKKASYASWVAMAILLLLAFVFARPFLESPGSLGADRAVNAIAAHAKGWTLARMPAIDRIVLRVAAFRSGLRRFDTGVAPWRADWVCYYFINDSAPASHSPPSARSPSHSENSRSPSPPRIVASRSRSLESGRR